MQSAPTNPQTPTPVQPAVDRLYRHTRRESWGVAVFLWERDGKRCYRFADGEVRVFKQGFWNLMVPTAAPADGSAAELQRQVRARVAREEGRELLPSVGDQLVLLLKSFPKGFAGQKWLEQHRNHASGKGRRLKRHRDPAIADARKLLDPAELSHEYGRGAWKEIRNRFADLLAGTDLVPAAQAGQVRELEPSSELAAAIIKLAQNPRDADLARLQTAIGNLGGPADSWQLLTAARALLAPDVHLCVRPSVFDLQGKIARSDAGRANFRASKQPSDAAYQRYLEVAHMVRDELRELGHGPTDMLDLHDFVWVTLRPAAHDELERVRGQGDVLRKSMKPRTDA